jgi:molybdenum cofactor cytidylyltransferase
MGREKALLPFGGETLLSAAIKSLQPFVQVVIVVAGKNADTLGAVIRAAGAELVINPEPGRGQFSSLRVGLEDAVRRGFSAAFITHVDRPPALASTLQSLFDAFTSDRQRSGEMRKWAVIPQVRTRHGHPIVVSEELSQAFLRAPHHLTARDVEHEHQDRMLYLDVDDENVVSNVNTPADYERLTGRSLL